MQTLGNVLDWVNLGLYTLVAFVALWYWRAGRGRAALWAALSFATLAVVVDVAAFLPEDPSGPAEYLFERSLIALLVLFPYLLYRFTTAFEEPTRRLERFLGLMTVAVVVWTFALPDVPADEEPRSAGFIAYLVAFLIHWTVLTVVVSVRLWHAGRGQPTVARRRMQLLSIASAALTLALLLSAASPDEDTVAGLIATLLTMLSALAFLLGLAPPAALRIVWRRPELEQTQDAIAGLMSATTPEEVTDKVLSPMTRIVGARALALCDANGALVGVHGATPEMVDRAIRRENDSEEQLLRLPVPYGSLIVWTSPYAPFFGHDELRVLYTLGALTGLALDRSRLFAEEREAREDLERANELKANFVALAAHELRTPVATIDGIVQTLHLRGELLTQDRKELLEETLRHQSRHMRILVDQLLDLSRLEAEAIRIEPAPILVRPKLEEIVAMAAGDRAREVKIQAEDTLEAVADPTAFERIVSNLVTNALRYGAPPVRLAAEQRDRHFRLSVEDRGSGVPPEFVPNLFERFTRSTTSGDRIAGGTGLGLAIARSYANAHGGDLVYEPVQPHGAHFRLILPLARPVPPPHGGTG